MSISLVSIQELYTLEFSSDFTFIYRTCLFVHVKESEFKALRGVTHEDVVYAFCSLATHTYAVVMHGKSGAPHCFLLGCMLYL
jgi:hypothetical protein